MDRLKMRRDGQSAVADAIIFLIIMLVASSIIISYSVGKAKEISSESEENRLVEMLYTSSMKSTVYDCAYINKDGEKIDFSNKSVKEILMEDLAIRKSGSANMNSLSDIEKKIKNIMDGLIPEGKYYYLECVSGNVRVVISNGMPSDEKTAFSQEVRLPGGDSANFIMYLW